MSHQEFHGLFRKCQARRTALCLCLFPQTPHRPLDDRPDVACLEGLEHEHPQARQQRRVQFERRVLGRGTDERDDAFLHPREKRILLRLVEPVNLVAEQDRAAPFEIAALCRLFDDLPHSRYALGHRTERLERPVCVVREQAGKRRFSRARRSPKDHAPHGAALDGVAEGLAWT